ncbi:MAG TPA: SPOR domain-containing protein [Xanthobacteraceae bacterium]
MADDTYPRGYRNDPYGRGGAAASGQGSDPLTELARLIGQSDPFAPDSGRDRRADERSPDPHGQPADWQNDAPASEAGYEHEESYDRYGARAPAPQADAPEDPRHYDDTGYRTADGYQSAAGYAPSIDPHYEQDHDEVPGYGSRGRDQAQAYAGEQPHQAMQYADSNGAVEQPGYDSEEARADQQPAYGVPRFGPAEHGQGSDEDYERYYEEDAPAPSRRGGWITAAALIGLAVIGTAGAFAYRSVFSTVGPPSIIARDAGPNKILPTTQNADNSSSKQIYDRGTDRGQNEKIVSREEKPITLPDPARNPPPRVIGQTPGAGVPAMPGGAAQPGMPSDASSLAPTGPGGEPKKIHTVTIKSDQASADSPPARPATPPRSVAGQAPAPRAAAAASNAPLSLSPQSATTPASPPAHTTALAPAAAAPSQRAATGGETAGGYFVQVTAQKSKEEAQASFRGIQAKYASVLGGHEPVIRRKDLGSKGVFYGAQVGPFSREGAAQLCENLKTAGASCMIQRN